MTCLSRPTQAEARAFVLALASWQAIPTLTPTPPSIMNDPVLARFLVALAPDIPQTFGPRVVWPDAYGPLWKAINPATGKHLRRRAWIEFLEHWYMHMEEQGCAQSGRLQPGNTSYVGHWCLEAAAAVMTGQKEMNVRNHPNYPADWADHARQSTGAA